MWRTDGRTETTPTTVAIHDSAKIPPTAVSIHDDGDFPLKAGMKSPNTKTGKSTAIITDLSPPSDRDVPWGP